jgi:hypothetical protein
MKRIAAGFLSFSVVVFLSQPAWAWGHANRYGGFTTHGYGYTHHTNAWGGSTTHAWGVGTTHTNMYGGTTAHAYGSGSVYHAGYGGYDHYYGGYAAAYHPSVAINAYAPGCYNCGGWAAAAGAAVGAAAGLAVGAAASSNAYASGYAAGSAATAYAMGGIYPILPSAGCVTPNVSGQTYYLCGNTWFSPFYGANGISYRVVPTP